VENPERRCRGVASAELDGSPADSKAIPLVDDGREHRVRVVLGLSHDAPSHRGPRPAVGANFRPS
jgi:cyclic beta-1,2-glucan synthetase